MASVSAIESFLDDTLSVERYDDASYNGLQVQGRITEIRRLVTGVTASAALIEKAAEAQAQAVLVHHGLFWKGQPPMLRGGMAQRAAVLFENQMSLLAYHLPIDAHPKMGNNAQMATLLGLEKPTPWGDYHGNAIGQLGRFAAPLAYDTVLKKIENMVGKKILHLGGGPRQIQTVALVSGGGSSLALQAARDGADLFLTGEPTEYCMHIAAEERMHIVAAGHHNTEIFGVRAVGDLLAAELDLEVTFIDVPNPV